MRCVPGIAARVGPWPALADPACSRASAPAPSTSVVQLHRPSVLRAAPSRTFPPPSAVSSHRSHRHAIGRSLDLDGSSCAASRPCGARLLAGTASRRGVLGGGGASGCHGEAPTSGPPWRQWQGLSRDDVVHGLLGGRAVSSSAVGSGTGGSGSDGSSGRISEVDEGRMPGADHSSLQKTTALVETAMLAAVSGLAYLIATILKIENSVGYFLPLPVVLAALRSGTTAAWKTMGATACLLVVLLGPMRAVSYVLLHGIVAATLGTLWANRVGWWVSVISAAFVRLGGQFTYLTLSSVTMNENFFWVVLNNVYSMLDQIAAAVGAAGAPSPATVTSMLFSLLLVNSLIYCFLLHVVFRLILQGMGFQLGPLPGIVRKYLYAGLSPEAQQQLERQAAEAAAAQQAARAARAF